MAYDFSAVCESGQTLYYNITSNTVPYTVEVTYESGYGAYNTFPTGDLTISETVEYNSITYSVTSIGNVAFYGCSGLTSLTIGNSVTSIEMGAFENCSGLTSVTIGNSVTSIVGYAFKNCSGLTSVTIGNSVTSIGAEAFSGCSGLTSVTIPNSVTSIGRGAFCNCSGLTSVTIPNSVTSIRSAAFEDCSGLTSVTIPNSVTSIYPYTFQNCSGLTSITIPEYVDTIGSSAFGGCSNLEVVNFNATNCKIMGNYYYENGEWSQYVEHYVFRDCTSLTALNIGENVTNIPACAFCGCNGLTTVTIPSSVTSIGDAAFSGCSGLNTINFNATNCQKTGPYQPPFEGCSQVTTLNIGENVTIIPAYAFSDLSSITSATIPNLVTSIGDCAFYSCRGLIGALTIPNSVTSIGEAAFGGCSGLTSVTIPNSVTSIGKFAFLNCSGISEPLYNANCFAYFPCGYATEYVIPEGIRQIVGGAFSGCSELISVTIPNSVTSIGNDAFRYCDGIAEPLYNANCFAFFPGNYDAEDYVIPEGIKQIAGGSFVNCRNISSVTIPKSATNIGGYAFSHCGSLKTINYNAKNCTLLGDYSIPEHGCASYYQPIFSYSPFSLLNIGDSVEFIPDSAFYGCNSIVGIYSFAENPPAIHPHTFESSISEIPVFVKCGNAEDYRSAENWSNFTNIQGSKYMLYVDVASEDSRMGMVAVTQAPDCTDGTAVITATPNNGYRFVQWNDGNTDNPRTIVVTEDITITATFERENGVEENSIESKISLYPNPVGNTLNITSSETISEIEIVNTLGQVVKRIEVNADNAVCDVEELKAGVYVVRIHGTVVSQRKFIKE